MNASELIERGRARLWRSRDGMSRTGDEREQVSELLEAALGRKPSPREEVPPAVQRRLESYIERRTTGEPIAHITGWIDFLDLRLSVKPGVFVPRYTTEFLAAESIKRLRRKRAPVALDVACGIGPVALSIAAAFPGGRVYGTDISDRSLALARSNARKHGLPNVRFLRGDMYSALPARLRGTVDLVASHPPYVPKDEVGDLPDELRRYEPATTLTDGSHDGLALTRAVVRGAREWLAPGGWLLIEIGVASAREARAEMVRGGYREVVSVKSPYPTNRIVTGRRGT